MMKYNTDFGVDPYNCWDTKFVSIFLQETLNLFGFSFKNLGSGLKSSIGSHKKAWAF
jgi:hypothetical protein